MLALEDLKLKEASDQAEHHQRPYDHHDLEAGLEHPHFIALRRTTQRFLPSPTFRRRSRLSPSPASDCG